MSPVVGTAWLGRLFAPWSWSGSNLGGPAANEINLPFAAVYWLVHALRGSPASPKGSGTPRFSSAPRWPATCSCGPFASVRQDPPSALSPMSSTPTLSPSAPIRSSSLPWCCCQGFRQSCSPRHPAVGAPKGRSPPRRQCAAPRIRILERAARAHDRALLALMPLLVGWLDGRAAASRAVRTLALAHRSSRSPPLTGSCRPCCSSRSMRPQRSPIRRAGSGPRAAPPLRSFWLNNNWGWKFAELLPYARAYRKFPLLILNSSCR